MESEKGMALTKDVDLSPAEEMLTSEVLEIIGGINFGALQGLDEAALEDTTFTVEEGEDSVFYDDDNQAPPPEEEVTSCVSVSRESRDTRGRGEEVEALSLQEDNETDSTADRHASTTQIELTEEIHNDFKTEPEEELRKATQSDSDGKKELYRSNPADQGLLRNLATEHFKNPRSFPEVENNHPRLQIFTEPSTSKRTGGEEERDPSHQQPGQAPASEWEPANVSKGETVPVELTAEVDLPHQTSAKGLQISGDSRDALDQLEQPDHNSHASAGEPPDSNPGYSTLPLPKKAGRKGCCKKASFNHHTSAKYDTISYRKIQRGNTRQKIEEFEFMMMNL